MKNRLAIIILRFIVFLGMAFHGAPRSERRESGDGGSGVRRGEQARERCRRVGRRRVRWLPEGIEGIEEGFAAAGYPRDLCSAIRYQDHTENVLLEPGKKTIIHVSLEKDPAAQYASVTAEIKLAVEPDRAAVFLDGNYAGHAHDFGGVGSAMLVSPGSHKIKIALPGYRTFETEVKLLANQKYEIKTVLPAGSVTQTDPLIKQN